VNAGNEDELYSSVDIAAEVEVESEAPEHNNKTAF
jgi:hypothetical protein